MRILLNSIIRLHWVQLLRVEVFLGVGASVENWLDERGFGGFLSRMQLF
jgi:hypothetical protein